MRQFYKYHYGFLLLLLSQFGFAQDQHFSQFYTTPLMQNPALCGSQYSMQANINYKNQWGAVAQPYSTSSASFDTKLGSPKRSKSFLAMGINFFDDNSGTSKLRTDAAQLSIAYQVHINQKNLFGGGLQGGVVQRRIDYGTFKWGSQYNGSFYDPDLPTNELSGMNNKYYADCGGGITWTHSNRSLSGKTSGANYVKWNLGVSVFHVNRPNISFTQQADNLHMKWVLHGQGIFNVGRSNLAFVPGFMAYKQGGAREIFYGTMMRFGLNQQSRYTGFVKGSAFSMGLFHRWADAFVCVFQYEFADYRVGVSYDVNHSDLKTATRGLGGFEVSASYMFSNSSKRSMRR